MIQTLHAPHLCMPLHFAGSYDQAASLPAGSSAFARAASSTAASSFQGPGILEVKCPFNKGSPETAAPPRQPQWYYMPQVRTEMPNGSVTLLAASRHHPT